MSGLASLSLRPGLRSVVRLSLMVIAAACANPALTVAQSPEPAKPAADPCAACRIDADRLHFRYVRDDSPLQSEAESQQEFDAYNEVVALAHSRPVAELERCASREVLFLDLVNDIRTDFQFKLVYFEGRLKRLRLLEPNKPLAEKGITKLYEGWVYPAKGSDPMCVVTTELPPGLDTALDYNPAKPVTIAAYSFKLIRYKSGETDPQRPGQQKTRRAPLLMGHSFTLVPAPEGTDARPWRTEFIPGVLALVGGISAVTLGLTWWFRRGDRAHRRELDARRARNPFNAPAAPAADAN